MGKICEISTTCATRLQVEKLALTVLNSRLAACASYWKIESRYCWRGRIVKGSEWMIAFKASVKNAKALEKKLLAIHPYKLPVVTRCFAVTSKTAGRWIERPGGLKGY